MCQSLSRKFWNPQSIYSDVISAIGVELNCLQWNNWKTVDHLTILHYCICVKYFTYTGYDGNQSVNSGSDHPWRMVTFQKSPSSILVPGLPTYGHLLFAEKVLAPRLEGLGHSWRMVWRNKSPMCFQWSFGKFYIRQWGICFMEAELHVLLWFTFSERKIVKKKRQHRLAVLETLYAGS